MPNKMMVYLTTQRIEALSDGVFAIAITLLVLEIKVPYVGENGNLWTELGRLWTSYFGYIFSFFMIGVYWANHHHIFNVYKRKRPLFRPAKRTLFDVHFLPAFSDGSVGRVYRRTRASTGGDDILRLGIVSPCVFLVYDLALRQPQTSTDRPKTFGHVYRQNNAPVCNLKYFVLCRDPYLAVERYRRVDSLLESDAALFAGPGAANLC